MIEKKIERQIAYLHAVYGLVAGVFFAIYASVEVVPFVTVLLWSLIVSYPAMFITKKVFKLNDEDYNLKSWLGKGFLYFFSVWIVAWVFAFNLV